MEVLTVEQMYRADAAAIAGGVSGPALMEAAGWAVARVIRKRWRPRRTAVLCGPGNNGGDGFVVARLLERAGWPVRLGLLGDPMALRGDAAQAFARWQGETRAFTPDVLDGCDLVVDALFGAGLARPLDGMAGVLVDEIERRRLPCVAVDVPSGVHGDSGAVLGAAPRAEVTVTFFRKKPGHLLLPGRPHCGEVVVADIGIPNSVLSEIAPRQWENGPALWALPRPAPDGHKYSRGHAVIVAGPMQGAARLAARAARRAGAGLVTVVGIDQIGDDPGNILVPLSAFDEVVADRRRNAFLVGPGSGRGADTRARVAAIIAAGKACVLDADALEVPPPGGGNVLLTPHDGEFGRAFPDLGGDRLCRARAAARNSGCAVLLKGPDTVVAAPDGRAVINAVAPPDLATAGTGDVLAGIAVGLMAQGMPAFEAGCAAAWLHGAAGALVGRGLIAEDLPPALPQVLARLDQGP